MFSSAACFRYWSICCWLKIDFFGFVQYEFSARNGISAMYCSLAQNWKSVESKIVLSICSFALLVRVWKLFCVWRYMCLGASI